MDYIKEDKKYIANTYNRIPIVAKKGRGATLVDIKKKKYIDFTSGIAVNSLGFSNFFWKRAVVKQINKLQHVSNLYYSKPQIKLAKRLCDLSSMKKVFFANSGAEANECAIKLARKYSYDNYGDTRSTIVTLKNSFHGRTMASLTATGQDKYHKYFSPFLDGIKHIEISSDFETYLTRDVCAVMIELVQGEGGVIDISEDFIKNLYKVCKKRDILLIVDEVQTGVGRCGTFLLSQQYPIKPDIITLAKGLAGGLPIGACLIGEKCKNVFDYSAHGSTFGGNPVSCAAANYVVKKASNPKFLSQVVKKGEYICDRLRASGQVEEVFNKGLMIGVKLKDKKVSDVVSLSVSKGTLVLSAKENLRLLPPLNIKMEEIDKGLVGLLEAINS